MSLVLHQEDRRGHPELCLLDFDLKQLLAEIRHDFPELGSRRIEVWLQRQPTLACITHDDAQACIQLHSILNHPQTPRQVLAFILRHELLHLIIPPREVDGMRKTHPPEFWEAERKLAPDWKLMWAWMKLTFASCLRTDKRQECTFVKTAWKRNMNQGRPTLEQIAVILESHPTRVKEVEDQFL